MGFEFKVAAQAARSEDVIEVTFPDPLGVVNAHRPTTAQSEILGSQLRLQPVQASLEFARIVFADRGDEVADFLRNALLDGLIDLPDLIGGWGPNDEGRNEVGLFNGLIQQFSGRPTVPSTASSSSQSSGGRRSTGKRTPGPGSIATG